MTGRYKIRKPLGRGYSPAPTAPRAVNVVASLSGVHDLRNERPPLGLRPRRTPTGWHDSEARADLKGDVLPKIPVVTGEDVNRADVSEVIVLNDPGREVLTVKVPIPPSVNAIWRSRAIPTNRTDRFGRPIYICSVYMTPEGKAWKTQAAKLFRSSGVRFPEKAKVVVEARAFWPDARGRDMNNLAKITCDALQASGVIADDKRLLWREMDFEIDRANPRLRLDVYQAGRPS